MLKGKTVVLGVSGSIAAYKIADLAKALGTTPAYLIGWPEETTDKKISPDELALTEGEKALIKLLRRVPASEQPIVIEKILSALDNQE